MLGWRKSQTNLFLFWLSRMLYVYASESYLRHKKKQKAKQNEIKKKKEIKKLLPQSGTVGLTSRHRFKAE